MTFSQMNKTYDKAMSTSVDYYYLTLWRVFLNIVCEWLITGD